jgi:glutamate-1-semialdehyde 2,1-aminomutase
MGLLLERKITAVVQARMLSTRLPGKVLKKISDKTLLEILTRRLMKSKKISDLIVATTDHPSDDLIVTECKRLGIKVFRGSQYDVLNRYFLAAEMSVADVVVRITADCPLIDSTLLDNLIDRFEDSDCEYASNTNPPSYPDGFDMEIFTFGILSRANLEATDLFDREHVTPWIKRHAKKTLNILALEDLSGLRLTIDEQVDFDLLSKLFSYPKVDWEIGWEDIIEFLKKETEELASAVLPTRNEGALLGKGQKLWKRAKAIIPGGNMLLSKRPEMFLPEKWPAYFDTASGCRVTDLDGNEYVDMSIMGIGTNILGYGRQEVDAAVADVVRKGNMSTLNCPEEVWLAEALLEINPWADMVRFARTGGEANAIAVRIARAASGKDGVAICGYHGWHDWYLAANLSEEKNLDGHLLPGLDPTGVPRNLKGSVFPFNFNDIGSLESLIKNQEIGAIVMEVSRNSDPEPGFLQKVRELASSNGIVLMFDECTSGFRETFGGLHMKFGVNPDMAMYGKALGNGYAITAVVGAREVMEVAQKSFISSTFWTERIGPVAALATLKVMKETRSWETVTRNGLKIRQGWEEMSQRFGLGLRHWGIPALAGYSFVGESSQVQKTYVTQEMLKKGYLASSSVYSSIAHTDNLIESYLEALGYVLDILSRYQDDPVATRSLLEGPVSHAGFQRLN